VRLLINANKKKQYAYIAAFQGTMLQSCTKAYFLHKVSIHLKIMQLRILYYLCFF